ncbi:MAG: DUF3943 domain-containing protein [Prevotellaceae bacterium]|nr:DUF3943 domain-containing protein [Prevotellaceae bacterium]
MSRTMCIVKIGFLLYLISAIAPTAIAQARVPQDSVLLQGCRHVDSFIICHQFILKKQQQEIDQLRLNLNYGHWTDIHTKKDNECIVSSPRNALLAAAEVMALNVGVWTFDLHVLNGDYAKINSHSIQDNFRTGFVWDNDGFNTNLFAHPYHGSLYFNAARANGMNFWESVPFAIGGSLSWEFIFENEPAAINDLLSTSIGGSCIGEITWRLSDLLVDNSTRGWRRAIKESGILLLSPMRGLNRLISGEFLEKGTCSNSTMDFPEMVFSVGLNYRRFAKSDDWRNEANGTEIELHFIYGNPMTEFENTPYSFFTLDAELNFFDKQPIIGSFRAKALLTGIQVREEDKADFLFGIFQHFNFQDSDPIDSNPAITPYEISEAAAFGIGGLCQFPFLRKFAFFCDLYLTGVVLGGSYTDYYRAVDRDYNLGSGYSMLLLPGISWRRIGELRLSAERIQLFSWKGYDKGTDFQKMSHQEMLHLNAQGDKSNTALSTFALQLKINLIKSEIGKLQISLSHIYYLRNTHYSYFPDVDYGVSESKIGIIYRIE